MGTVALSSGVTIYVEEIEGTVSLEQLFEDASCEHYTISYRSRVIKVWGKLKRQGWAILPVLHELKEGENEKLSTVAREAIKLIDPGAPIIPIATGKVPVSNTITTPYTPYKRDNTFPVSNNHVTTWKKPEKMNVSFTEVLVENGDLSEGAKTSGICAFCNKNTVFTKPLRTISKAISGFNKKVFCNFCLRNEFYKSYYDRHILLMSFRGIIAYYYYAFHLIPKSANMYLTEIEAHIHLHAKVGLQNPLFKYDPETYIWFVDFSKVGNKPKQIPLKYVFETVTEILLSFDMYMNLKDVSPATFFQKYKDSITDFHHHRRRPTGQRILTPTLYNCGLPHETGASKSVPVVKIKNFTHNEMIENYKYRQRNINII